MKLRDVDVSQFKSIEELYDFIDCNSFELQRYRCFRDVFTNYMRYATITKDKAKAKYEWEIALFQVYENKIFSFAYSSQKINKVIKYPSLHKDEMPGFDYLKKRAESCKNIFLKARYNHILWKSISEIKNRQYALNAVNHYQHSIRALCLEQLDSASNEKCEDIAYLFESLLALASEVNADFDEIRNLTSSLLYGNFPFFLKNAVVQDMLTANKIFKQINFVHVLPLYEKELSSRHSRTNDFLLIHTFLQDALKVAQKIKVDEHKWQNELGMAYLRMAEKESNPNRNWLKAQLYNQAIIHFKFSNNKEKLNETIKRNSDLKPFIIIQGHEFKFSSKTIRTLQEFDKLNSHKVKELLKKTPDEIYEYISSAHIFPSAEKIESFDGDNLDTFFTLVQFDRNKNIVKNSVKTNLTRGRVFDFYGLSLSNQTLKFLHLLFLEGIKSGILTYENFIVYIKDKTWIGQPYNRTKVSGENFDQDWIALLTPSIVEFFIQLQAGLNTKFYTPNFILCIDSLAMKIEGLLRNFCERKNMPVSKITNKGMKEILLNDLLESETLLESFDKDEMLFFNYLLGGDGGVNYRNNIAHCFYNFNDYSIDKMLLLIATLLRVGKYYYPGHAS